MRGLAAILATTALAGCAATAGAPTSPAAAPWANRTLGADARADLLLRAMTVPEKVAMASGLSVSAIQARPGETRLGAGLVQGVPRLGIPDQFETDASLGVSNVLDFRKGDVATALPAGLATAASFDPTLAHDGGVMIGSEARAKGFTIMLAGGVNLIRDPWGGRNFEYYSEDALLSGILAGEQIRGIQSNNIVSTVKHLALNSQETGRYVVDARLAENRLRESDLLAFQIAIERGDPGSVMCAYNGVNGDQACESGFLMNDVVKRDWGFKGWIMSDWGAGKKAPVRATLAGLDQISGQDLDEPLPPGGALGAAVARGEVSAARLDDMVRRILRALFASGAIDNPAVMRPIDYAAHAQVAQRVAEQGSVLLRNEGGLLPLTAAVKNILIVGGHADRAVASGGGSTSVRSVGGTPIELPFPGGGPMSRWMRKIYHASSPLDAIRARAPGAVVSFADGSDPAKAAALARAADVVIVFAEQWRTESEDIPTLALPDRQDGLIEAVAAANPRTVVVLETGGAVLMPWLGRVGAVLAAWYPGQRGGEAIARLLWGDVNPSGRLPITFPASDTQMPRPAIPGLKMVEDAKAYAASHPDERIDSRMRTFPVPYVEGADTGYRWFAREGQKPLFPFGFGLSYTRFSYGGLKVAGGNTLKISFTVTNVGDRAGADVAQIYAAVADGGGPPVNRLVGFERVMLAPGERRQITINADPRLIATYDVDGRKWHVAGGLVPVTVGRFAGDNLLRDSARLTERRFGP